MKLTTLIRIRRMAFLSIGLACIAFVTLVISAYQEWSYFAWWPAIVGLVAACTIFGAAWLSGGTISKQVWDELSQQEWGQAIGLGYWLAIAMYPIFGLLMWGGIVDFRQAFACMGVLTGGLPLLYFALLDIRGR